MVQIRVVAQLSQAKINVFQKFSSLRRLLWGCSVGNFLKTVDFILSDKQRDLLIVRFFRILEHCYSACLRMTPLNIHEWICILAAYQVRNLQMNTYAFVWKCKIKDFGY